MSTSTTAAAAAPFTADGRFVMRTKPQPLDHKLWKNALEVRINQIDYSKDIKFCAALVTEIPFSIFSMSL